MEGLKSDIEVHERTAVRDRSACNARLILLSSNFNFCNYFYKHDGGYYYVFLFFRLQLSQVMLDAVWIFAVEQLK